MNSASGQLRQFGWDEWFDVREGVLQRAHYRNFIKLRSESEFHDLSQLEKRKKDKAFGRYIKSAKKDPGFTRK